MPTKQEQQERQKQRERHAGKTPMRTCCACGAKRDKRSFVRIVRTPEGAVRIDAKGTGAGRGAYLCKQRECLERARWQRRVGAALRMKLDGEAFERLERELGLLLGTTGGERACDAPAGEGMVG